MTYRSECHRMAKGVAGMKIDQNARFVNGEGVGYQIVGFQNADPDKKQDVIIKAKLDNNYVHPRHLCNRKVFYRFYLARDRRGKLRRYLVINARSNNVGYWGSRCVILSKNGGAYLSLEKSMREKLDKLRCNETGGYQPDESLDIFCEEQWPEHI